MNSCTSSHLCTSSQLGSPLSHLLLHPRDGIGTVVPRCFDQVFEGRISRVFQSPDVDVASSLAGASEQAMLVVELRTEKQPKSDMSLCGRNVTDPVKRRIAERIVDGVVIEELVRSRYRSSCHVAQLSAYFPYFFRIVRKKLFDEIRHGTFSSLLHPAFARLLFEPSPTKFQPPPLPREYMGASKRVGRHQESRDLGAGEDIFNSGKNPMNVGNDSWRCLRSMTGTGFSSIRRFGSF